MRSREVGLWGYISTFIWLADVVFLLQGGRLGRVVDVERDFHLRVESQVAVTDNVQNKCEVAHRRWCLELHFQGLHVKCGLAILIEYRLVESREGEWWHGHLSLLGVG